MTEDQIPEKLPLAAPTGSPYVWTGDLDDDCCCRHGDYFAHVEMMDEAFIHQVDEDEPDTSGPDPEPEEIWWFSVHFKDEQIFNSSDHAGLIIGGPLARALAEAIMGNDQAERP